ncbi:hypothetical protein DY000_02008304 [Brassica cretica]|uniref:Uncharacterized protein n=1 Tax=Brassica cretica TaxID=69181 RepID=A0ABQ7CK49_BRACR|nr:hypothetical protein DY000_02008304 [Brassica cretica]
MEGFPSRKFSISWKGARFRGPSSGFLLAGTRSVPLSGTRGSGSCLEAGENGTGVFFPNSLPLISRFRHRSRGITCALKSTGVAHSQQAPLRQDPIPLILISWVPLKAELILNPDGGAGTLMLRCVQAGESRRDDTGNGFLKISLVLRVPRTEGTGSLIVLQDSFFRADDKWTRSRPRLLFNRNATVGEAPPPPGGDRLSPVGPLSVIGVEEVANWRKKFRLPDDVTIRIPGPFDRVSDFELGEIPVYEGFFESGFRDQIPSLVAEISKAVKISHVQLNPPSWRILIAMQNLGDLEGFTVGVTEVLYCYSISLLNGGEFRYHLNPRGKAFPVRELSKVERKQCLVFEGCWTAKFAFMPFPGFSPTWCVAGGS